MNGYHFTERVRRSLAMAREEAARLNHEYVGPQHMLLGLIADRESMAGHVLEELAIDPDAIRQKVVELVTRGTSSTPRTDLPYTSRAKKALEFAMTEARDLGHSYVGSAHLLLGLLREEKGIAAQVLVYVGLDTGRARESVRRLSASGEEAGAEPLEVIAHMPLVASGSARVLLTASAVLAWLIGIMLIFVPKDFEAPMGIVVDDKSATIAQAQGAILFGLGFINWLARGVTDRRALWAILYGNFVVQLLSFAVVLRALVHGYVPTSAVGAATMHVLLGAAFVWQMFSLRRSG